MTPDNKKRLGLDIDRMVYQDLKKLAVNYNISITKLVQQLIVQKLYEQKIIDGE